MIGENQRTKFTPLHSSWKSAQGALFTPPNQNNLIDEELDNVPYAITCVVVWQTTKGAMILLVQAIISKYNLLQTNLHTSKFAWFFEVLIKTSI